MNSLSTGSLTGPPLGLEEGCAVASDSLEGNASAALVLALAALRMIFGRLVVTGMALMGRWRVKLVAGNDVGT